MFRRVANSSVACCCALPLQYVLRHPPSTRTSIRSSVLRVRRLYVLYVSRSSYIINTGLYQGLPSLCSSLPLHRIRLSSLQGLINTFFFQFRCWRFMLLPLLLRSRLVNELRSLFYLSGSWSLRLCSATSYRGSPSPSTTPSALPAWVPVFPVAGYESAVAAVKEKTRHIGFFSG